MSDVELLTLKLLDGTISEREHVELERLIAESARARALYVALCDQEAALRGNAMGLDVSRAVMEGVSRSPAAHTAPSRKPVSGVDVAGMTLKLLDGELEDSELVALEARLAGDEQARALHVALCDQEAALRSVRRGFDVREQVMSRLQAETKPHGRPATTRGRRRSTSRRAARSAPGRRASWGILAPLALAAVLLLAAGVTFVLWKPFAPDRAGRVEVPAPVKVVRADPGAVLTRNGGQMPLAAGTDLLPGDGIAMPADSTVAIGYGDGTRLTLRGGGSLTVQPARREGSPVTGKRVLLARGALTADVAKQAPSDPLVCLTPTAHATVLGTRFVLSATEARTRLEVAEGAVRLTRDADGATADVRDGHYADVTAGAELVVERMPRRARAGLLALFRFTEGRGHSVRDLSGVGEHLDLHIRDTGAVRWPPGGGLAIDKPTLIASDRAARKITQACQRTGEFTIEAWVEPSRADQSGPARIVTVSEDSDAANVMLGQEVSAGGGAYVVRVSTTETNGAGDPTEPWPPVAVELRRTHVVCTHTASGKLRLYIDGVLRGTGAAGGGFAGWDASYRLALGNEVRSERPWLGTYHLVAVYDRALAASQVLENYRATTWPTR